MKKTLAAFVAVATIAGSLAATPASAQRGVAAGVAAGLIGGAIVGGAIASSRPAYGPARSMWKSAPALPLGSRALLGRLRLALPPRRRSATDPSRRAIHRAWISKPGRCIGRVFLFASGRQSEFSARRADRAQHRFARPAIHLEPGRFLVGAERGARLHPGLAVELVLVETEAREAGAAWLRHRRCAAGSMPTTASRMVAGSACGRLRWPTNST